jgi:hypothetical protein
MAGEAAVDGGQPAEVTDIVGTAKWEFTALDHRGTGG